MGAGNNSDGRWRPIGDWAPCHYPSPHESKSSGGKCWAKCCIVEGCANQRFATVMSTDQPEGCSDRRQARVNRMHAAHPGAARLAPARRLRICWVWKSSLSTSINHRKYHSNVTLKTEHQSQQCQQAVHFIYWLFARLRMSHNIITNN